MQLVGLGGENVAIGERRRSEAKWMKWIRRWIPADPSDRTLPQLQAVTGLDGCSAATCSVDWLVAAATLIHSRVRRPQSEKPGKFRKARPRHEKVVVGRANLSAMPLDACVLGCSYKTLPSPRSCPDCHLSRPTYLRSLLRSLLRPSSVQVPILDHGRLWTACPPWARHVGHP